MTTELTQEQGQALEAATRGAFYTVDGGWECKVVATRDTLEDFIASVRGYAEWTTPKTGTIAGLPFLAFRSVQPRSGDTRRALSVLDMGDYRLALMGEALTDY